MVNFTPSLLTAVEDCGWMAAAVEILVFSTGLAGFFMYRMYGMPQGAMDGGVVEFNALVSFSFHNIGYFVAIHTFFTQ